MGVTKKIGAATNSRKNYKKKPGGELICKNFGVNGNRVLVKAIFEALKCLKNSALRPQSCSRLKPYY